MNLAELGFGSAVVFSMYKPIAENDTETICALMNLYKRIYFIIGVVVSSLGICILPIIPYLIKGTYPNDINIYFLFILYLINTSFTYFLFAYKSVLLIAHQRSDITSNVLTFSFSIQYVFQIIVLYITHNYYLFMVVNLFTTVLNNIIVSVIVDKKYPQYKCSGNVSSELKEQIKKKVFGLLIQRVCATTRNSLDSIFISFFLGLGYVALYNNYYYVMNSVIGFMGIISTAILAGVGNSIVTETKEKNYNDMSKFNFIYMWLAGIATVCMLCLYQPFIVLWMGRKCVLPFSIVVLMCIYFYVLKMGDMRATYSDAAGLWWENRYRALSETIANILLNIILGKFFGLVGIILATLISLFVINYLYGSQILFNFYFTDISVFDYFKKNTVYLITTCVAGLLSLKITDLIKFNGIIGILAKLVLCLIVTNLIYVLFFFRTKHFKESCLFVKTVIKKRFSV